jgi:hypothetical protein
LKKRPSERFQFTSKEKHIFGQKGIAKRYAKVMQKEDAKCSAIYVMYYAYDLGQGRCYETPL